MLYFTLFWQLAKMPIQLWDESRNVQNAIAMSDSGNYLVTYFEKSPDLWNTKPPLLIWLQVLCIKVFGYREIAFRLPTALAGMLTALSLFFWFYLREKNIWKGFSVSTILLTTLGYVHMHCTRTGDYDALMILWVTTAILTFYQYIDTNQKKYLYLSAMYMALAALTKGVHAFIVMPFMYIFWLLKSKNLSTVFKNGLIYFVIAVVPLMVYYYTRESVNPGYLRAVMDNEWGGRYLKTLEDHKFPWYFYLQHHFNTGTKFWFPLAIFSLFGYIDIYRKKKIHTFSSYILLLIFGYHFVIAMSQTKLDWYGNTLYPLYALFITDVFYTIFKNKYAFIAIVLIAIFPLYLVLMNNYDFSNPYEDDSCHTAKVLQTELKKNTLPDTAKIIAYGYIPHIKYYVYSAAKQGKYLSIVEERNVSEGDIVFTHRKQSIDTLAAYFTIKELRGYKTAKKLLILEKRGIVER
jgi:4-amino-4-deoxy-L-arabinose transferase-like glycosyltransferase